jgi:hypothetical protein
MSTIKIEHVDPNSSRAIAFDIMSGSEVKDTFVLERSGSFKILELSGNLVLHEVSEGELTERDRLVREEQEAAAAKMKAVLDKADAKKAKEVAAEQKKKDNAAKRAASKGARKAKPKKARAAKSAKAKRKAR